MENINTVNSVNISLSEYNITKSNLDIARDLLQKAQVEINILREQEPKNKVIVTERRVVDPRYGCEKTVEKLSFNIDDPSASNKLLEVISKVETSELSTKLEDKSREIINLKDHIANLNETIATTDRANRSQLRNVTDENSDKIRKLKKNYDDQILTLVEDKETLSKALEDLKVDKTQEQLELAHVEELSELNEKITALEDFKSEVTSVASNPWKLKSFLSSFQNTSNFIKDRPWLNKMSQRVHDAVERVELFAETIKSIGKLSKDVIYTPASINNSVFYSTPRACYQIDATTESW
jgi:hypothetical protein